jgi:alpha-aminoadipate/glutamate carrier protein LysW
MAQVVSAKCPDCQTTIRFDEVPGLGSLVTCPECGAELEVVRKNPLELDWAYEEEFDDDEWEEEWDEEWEDEDLDDDDEEEYDDLDDEDDF